MGIKPSKQALREVAELLGISTAAARAYLREVQTAVGPVTFQAIVDVMRRTGGRTVDEVVSAVRQSAADRSADHDGG